MLIILVIITNIIKAKKVKAKSFPKQQGLVGSINLDFHSPQPDTARPHIWG